MAQDIRLEHTGSLGMYGQMLKIHLYQSRLRPGATAGSMSLPLPSLSVLQVSNILCWWPTTLSRRRI